MLNGKQIGDYVLMEELGRGSFGCVYKCQNIIDQSFHAIKIIQFQSLSNCEGVVGELLKDEISVLTKIDSPNVLKLEHYFQSKSNCYIVMEYCNGGDLERYWTREGKRIKEQKALEIVIQILNGLSELHKQNVIHRDIKLANILMHNDQIKIADLGFCKQLQNQEMEVSLCLGTPGTMAPEVASFESYGLQSDIFSIGCIFYQLLYGELPFDYSILQYHNHSMLEQIDFNKNNVVIQDELKEIISKMLKDEPKKRLTFPQLYQYPLFRNTQKMSQVSKIAIQNMTNPETTNYYEEIYKNQQDIQIGQQGMTALKQNGDIFKTQTEKQNQQSQFMSNLQNANNSNRNLFVQDQVSKLTYEIMAAQQLRPNQQQINNALQELQDNEQIFKTDRFKHNYSMTANSQQNQKLCQQFRFLLDALQYCDRTYIEIDQIQFLDESQTLIGKFMIQKRIRSESKKFFQVQQENPFYDELNQMGEAFKPYVQNQLFEKLHQQIISSSSLLSRLTQPFINELKDEETGIFHLHYWEALNELHQLIKKEINREADNKRKKILVIALLHLQGCMHFQDLCTLKIDFEEEFLHIKKKNLIELIKKVQY
ncbi:unnamed protein product (macronuclear) [Paramecium tetraurelia]|uniref:Protein kinase domain-containing protein n=1 Tax=Paramecium tetraurelia TaxID=5888 RepID=A0CJM5_PARTE|nr:uncharacterized protein GSPATT00000704001 [Paramecium tetraurelia]CAK70992.1 unnamed protein product [Paramecium tetraurelia]|eukprot:XP_001438389.1 hypothetical protein (macronuclear) [Paramecium tetraurelia strain d4-2]